MLEAGFSSQNKHGCCMLDKETIWTLVLEYGPKLRQIPQGTYENRVIELVEYFVEMTPLHWSLEEAFSATHMVLSSLQFSQSLLHTSNNVSHCIIFNFIIIRLCIHDVLLDCFTYVHAGCTHKSQLINKVPTGICIGPMFKENQDLWKFSLVNFTWETL